MISWRAENSTHLPPPLCVHPHYHFVTCNFFNIFFYHLYQLATFTLCASSLSFCNLQFLKYFLLSYLPAWHITQCASWIYYLQDLLFFSILAILVLMIKLPSFSSPLSLWNTVLLHTLVKECPCCRCHLPDSQCLAN